MYLIIEEYQYQSAAAKQIIHEVFPWERDGAMDLDCVGYHYSAELGDTVFFLPKVVVHENGKLFGKEEYDPETLLNLTKALEEGRITDNDYNFLYGFSVWIYRAISEYRKEQESKPKEERSSIIYSRNRATVGTTGQMVYNTILDIMLSLIQFNEENQDYFTFVLRNIHSGFNKINWTKTISKSQAIIQGSSVVYVDAINKKKQINFEEELFIIFFSILQHLNERYGFPVKINFGYELLTEDEFQNYLDGFGTIRLEQIRYKYFSDKQIYLWQLCYDFFAMANHVNTSEQKDDYLVVKNFNIVFEAMIDRLLSDKRDKRIDKLDLKDQKDGKRVDHIYAYQGLIHNQGDIYYIGDSKYYKQNNDPGSESVYKQYTYARNVIQANLNLFNNQEGNYEAGKDYLVYLDKETEGYNITPNFFIRAFIGKDKDYNADGLELRKSEKPNYHFPNRLFDRDTLLLQHYNINFLYVLSVYGSDDDAAQQTFKKKAQKLFREKIITEIENSYQFFSLQLKPIEVAVEDDDDEEIETTDRDKMNRLIEQKYFHRLLGKAFRPFKEEQFLYLSLEKNEEFYAENMKLLSDLSQDFNIRYYKLGSDPRDTINTFAELTYNGIEAGKGEQGAGRAYRYDEFKDEVFLVGGYRSDKKHLDWIKENKLYNIRANVNRHGYRSGIIDENVVSARYLVLYNIGDHGKRDYHVYRIEDWKTRSQKWMENHGYDNPSGQYIVYSLSDEVSFEPAIVNAMLERGLYKELEYRKEEREESLDSWTDEEYFGAPMFLSGQEISDFALASHRQSNKALVVVNINDKDLSKMEQGYSAALFVAAKTIDTMKEFTTASYLIYSNKQAHKVFRIVGDSTITASVPQGYLDRRFAEVLRDEYPDKKERDKVEPQFYLNFAVVPDTSGLEIDQKVINKVPEGLSGYDAHVIEISDNKI